MGYTLGRNSVRKTFQASCRVLRWRMVSEAMQEGLFEYILRVEKPA